MQTKHPISILGIPSDENSSFMRGPALSPPRIRESFYSASTNSTTELGLDLSSCGGWSDRGDLTLAHGAKARDQITAGVAGLLEQGERVISLGGDHSVTFPIMRAYAAAYPDLTIVQIDAHGDLYEQLDGNRFAHACPFTRIMEAGLAQHLIQIGIRAMTAEQWQQVERFGVEVVPAWEYSAESLTTASLTPDTNIYISLDLDGLDPAFAPGVSHHEPGGLTSRDVLHLIQHIPGNIVGADIVELNPHRDLVNMTAMLAGKLLKEMLARMLADS